MKVKKYNKYLTCECCLLLKSKGYASVIENIIDDDEASITEEMKVEFFQYLLNYDSAVDVISYCDAFFNQPSKATLDKKKYLLKGKEVKDFDHKKMTLGRVPSKKGFRRIFNSSILTHFITDPSSPTPISDIDDDSLIELFILDYDKESSSTKNRFPDFIDAAGISNIKLQEHPMWTFEGLYNDDPFKGYEVKDLPCILGLPGPAGTAEEYDSIERIALALTIPVDLIVRKPTCFDAGTVAVWQPGGKTKTHTSCQPKYGKNGFNEYIHEPIFFENIMSNLYQL